MTYGPWRRRFRVKSRPTGPVGIAPGVTTEWAGEGEIVKIRFVYRWNAFSIVLSTANPNNIDTITSWRGDRGFCEFLAENESKAFHAGILYILVFHSTNTRDENTNRFQNAQNYRETELYSAIFVVSKRVALRFFGNCAVTVFFRDVSSKRNLSH